MRTLPSGLSYYSEQEGLIALRISLSSQGEWKK
jgi:hypothetical protein